MALVHSGLGQLARVAIYKYNDSESEYEELLQMLCWIILKI